MPEDIHFTKNLPGIWKTTLSEAAALHEAAA